MHSRGCRCLQPLQLLVESLPTATRSSALAAILAALAQSFAQATILLGPLLCADLHSLLKSLHVSSFAVSSACCFPSRSELS